MKTKVWLSNISSKVAQAIDLLVQIQNHLAHEPLGEPIYIVIWALIGGDGMPSESAFTIQASGGRATLDAYRLIQVTRWLLLGPGKVRTFIVGQNIQNIQACAQKALAGIAGVYGEGKFDVAEVGQRIIFEIDRNQQ